MRPVIEQKIIRNLKKFESYNKDRHRMFVECSPREAVQILYLLPWMLSVNHPKVPGYIDGARHSFRVHGVDRSAEIKKRDSSFRRLFGVGDAVLFARKAVRSIEGLYSIGSAGTLAQTQDSDCDIWICCDSKVIGMEGWKVLQQKVNIIKDWLDTHCRMPVYFFLSDLEAIRRGDFGRAVDEGSGSAQKNVLKEEFYRTSIVILGKVPFWWVCWDREGVLSYEETWAGVCEGGRLCDDLVNLGGLDTVSYQEFLGAALWQLHKALTSPLKSVIKMTFLHMYLDRPHEVLPCHRFREQVLGEERGFQDPVSFSMELILREYGSQLPDDEHRLLVRCFYLRCSLTAFETKRSMRKAQSQGFVQTAGLSHDDCFELDAFEEWDAARQVRLGKMMMLRLFRFYEDIVRKAAGVASIMDRRDLTVLGRRITAIYQKKKFKVVHLPRPGQAFNLASLEFVWSGSGWKLYSGSGREVPLLAEVNILEAVAFGVWNGLYDRTAMRMEPNATSVSLQEIINLSEKIKDIFGVCDVVERDADVFLKAERFTKILIVISFEKSPYEKDINDLGVIFANAWGELYVRRFQSPFALNAFMRKYKTGNPGLEVYYYLQRNASYYEKIIERTKRLTALFLGSGSG
ncbi:class I adenylate cyclase [Desulfobotulus sp. H1]|uniref:Class I adenylate cyclase n=1 Tax=Desulfobotulus pelophilus TaxID=2823377 RepID=A0ABT3N5S8_9BACT|nr:class I adenylate cyclase [Desulfobotulus pelophilus]MCW7752814.1 class I adenylate cyclase [Desulfobotulus pelophilus]